MCYYVCVYVFVCVTVCVLDALLGSLLFYRVVLFTLLFKQDPGWLLEAQLVELNVDTLTHNSASWLQFNTFLTTSLACMCEWVCV